VSTKSVLIAILISICMTSIDSKAINDINARSTLRNLKDFGVIVEQTYVDGRGNENTSSSLQTEIELKLRMAGIKILSREELKDERDTPVLTAKYTVVSDWGRYFDFYNVEIELRQLVSLFRDKKIISPAITWSSMRRGSPKYGKGKDEAKRALFELIDEFINSFLAENPKK